MDASRLAGSAMRTVLFEPVLIQSGSQPGRLFWRTSTVLMLVCLLLAAGAFEGRLIAQADARQEARASSDESAGSAPPTQTPTSPAPALKHSTPDDPAEKSKATFVEQPPDPIPPDPIPSLSGFRFAPWYELDDDRLWQQIGWKIDLLHLPDDIDRFVELMQSPPFRKSALDLDHNVVAALGVKRLNELPNIESLRLSRGIPFSPKQMEEVARLPRLRSLDFSGSQIGDDHVRALPPARTLQVLNLENTQITGHSLKSIAELHNLEELYLGIGPTE
jgi:hypothetical protein